jgi:phosphoglucomutase
LKFLPFKEGIAKGLIKEIGDELDNPYFQAISQFSLRRHEKLSAKVVYTPLHGTGDYPVTKALGLFGFHDVTTVPEQKNPDGTFPTVKFPNPEDPEALAMALALAKKTNADLVIGTDPDTDRIGVIVREGVDYTFFNGNQLGCLLTNYFLFTLKEKSKLPPNSLVVKTIVTTDLQADIAKEYGASCEETLTGFKWICGLVEEYESRQRKPYKEYVCGGEESFGFLAGHFVRDKDAVSAACIATEMVAYYKQKGLSCSQVLDQMFQKHGLYQESLFTLTLPGLEGAEKIKSMMTKLRKNPPKAIDQIGVRTICDYELRVATHFSGESISASSLELPKSDVLQFILDDGTKVSVRPSGTEPKIKFYISVKDPRARNSSASNLIKYKGEAISRLKRIESMFVGLATES